MNSHRMQALGSLLIVGLAVTVASCSSDGSGETAASDDALQIVVTPVVDAAPLYLAQQEGIFEEHGLEVELSVGQGATGVTEALQTGDADLAMMSYVNLFSGRVNGLPVKIVSPITVSAAEEAGIYTAPGSGIKELSDLEGKKFGTPAPGSVAELTVRAALDTVALDASSYELVQVPLPNLVSAVESGQVDYTAMFSPFTLQAEDAGLVRIYDAFSGDTADFPSAAVVASEDWIDGSEDVQEAFRDALTEAVELANSDENAVREILPEYTGLSPEAAATVSIPTFVAELPDEEIQRVPDLMAQFGMLPDATDVSTAVAW